MGNTPKYTRKAIDKYNSKFEKLQINTPKGTKARIEAVAPIDPKSGKKKSATQIINALIADYLEQNEQQNENGTKCPF